MNDIHGYVSTCNSTNLFFIKDKAIYTSNGKYCLNGITREKVIQICKKNQIPCFQKNFKFKEIENCDEAFVTGTFAGVIPVSKLENRNYGFRVDDRYSLFILAIFFKEIPFGHSTSHAPVFVQFPNPSSSICFTIFKTLCFDSTLPCGSSAY